MRNVKNSKFHKVVLLSKKATFLNHGIYVHAHRVYSLSTVQIKKL